MRAGTAAAVFELLVRAGVPALAARVQLQQQAGAAEVGARGLRHRVRPQPRDAAIVGGLSPRLLLLLLLLLLREPGGREQLRERVAVLLRRRPPRRVGGGRRPSGRR